MSSVTELVYQDCLQRLTGIPGLPLYDRKHVAVFDRTEMPCFHVLEGADLRIEPFSDTEDLRELTLKVMFYLHGPEQVDGADAFRCEVARRLWEDPTLGGLAHWLATADRPEPERSEADGLRERITQRFLIRYVTNDADLSRPV